MPTGLLECLFQTLSLQYYYLLIKKCFVKDEILFYNNYDFISQV